MQKTNQGKSQGLNDQKKFPPWGYVTPTDDVHLEAKNTRGLYDVCHVAQTPIRYALGEQLPTRIGDDIAT